MSYEDIFSESYRPEIQTAKIKGGYLEYVKSGGDYSVSRLISTDPRMYLNARIAPGARFGFHSEALRLPSASEKDTNPLYKG